MEVKYQAHTMTVGELVRRVNRGDKVEITHYPPFIQDEPVTEDMRYINIEAYDLKELEEACRDAFGRKALRHYDALAGALRARRRAVLESPLFTSTADGGWSKIPNIMLRNEKTEKGGDPEQVPTVGSPTNSFSEVKGA